MHRVVKDVFVVMICCTVALLLYFVFFGVHLAEYGDWEGLIWFSARAIETPISKYYYDYCYLPNIHGSDFVDEALGGSPAVSDLSETPSDLSNPNNDTYTFDGVAEHYSTGWY